MKRQLLFLLAAIALYVTGCKLDPPVYGPPPKEDWSRSFQPLSKGSFWKYEIDVEGKEPDTATLSVTGETPTINDSLYHTIYSVSKKVNGFGYVYAQDHVIANRTISLAYGAELEILFLVDTAAVGDTWTRKITDDGKLDGVPARMIGTIKEVGTTRIVNGVTFPRVTHTQLLLQKDYGTGFETFATFDYYINMGVGVIENDGVQSDGTDLGKLKLISYDIK